MIECSLNLAQRMIGKCSVSQIFILVLISFTDLRVIHARRSLPAVEGGYSPMSYVVRCRHVHIRFATILITTPKLSTNISFYRWQMWTSNFRICNCSNEKGFTYMWPK